ncbi:transcription factor RFX3 [Camelus ferus]|nr:transcription factor RFX3 [Camelus ferus]
MVKMIINMHGLSLEDVGGETIMQTSETGSDTGSTVTLQTSVASQAAVPTQVVQQVPVQQQLRLTKVLMFAFQVQQVQTVQQVQHVYPAQVQYVEGSDTVYTNGAIRTTTYPYTETQMYSQNTGGNYFDTQGSSAQVTTVVSSHSMVGTGGIQMGVTGGQLISSSGGTYLIGNSMENSGHSVTHPTRASPATALCRGSIGGLSPLVIPKAGKLFIDLYQFSTPEACQPSTISVVCLNTVQKSSSPVSESVSAVVLDQGFLSLADYRPQNASRALPEFGEVEISSLPDGTTFEDIKSLQSLYREHCEVAAVSAFAQTLRRYTSLNHLAQAARAVLQNTSQINQMLNDLNRVDFANVQEQASWVCQCDDNMVQRLETDFKMTLQQQSTLEQWAAWLDNVMMQALKPYEGRPSFPKAARQFLLKWSFYSSMVIRDLTLRSAASFGSFHLIRLLYDEYMFYLVEHRVAQATGETPIAVMDEGSEVESEMDEELDDSSEPQAKREKTELNQAFPVGCMQPVLESGVQPSLLNPIHSEHIVTSTQTIRQCSATGNTYTAV